MTRSSDAKSGKTISAKVEGVVIGVVAAISSTGAPLVAYSGNRSDLPVIAKSTVAVASDAIGREVAILFEGGDITLPIIMGLIHNEELEPTPSPVDVKAEAEHDKQVETWLPNTKTEAVELNRDGERIELVAEKEIVLKCGKASITMTRAGKVIIRGAYVSTRSSGANRIKGGSVQIN